jgi:hypothetical protein
MPLSIFFSHRIGKRFAGRVHLPKKSFIALWRVPLSAFLAVIMFLPGGCGFMPPAVRRIPEEETTSVRAGQKSMVLFRLAPRLDNIPITPADKALGPDRPFFILRANIDRREKPWAFRAFSPSTEAAAENWVYYLLSPGEYWLGIQTPINTAASNKTYFPKNNYFLEVPEGVPLLYAGTLSFSCTSRWGLFVRSIDRCDNVLIEDESKAAEIVARRDFGGLGQMETALLRPSTRETMAKNPADLAPMGVILKGQLPLSTPDWKKRGVGRATGLGSSITGETVADLGGGDGSFGAGLILGYLLYLPFGTVGGLIGGDYSDGKWSPCMNTIASEVVNWSPPDALRMAMVEALARRGVDNITVVDNVSLDLHEDGQPQVRTLFEIEIQEMAFRECGKRWTFCGEMKVRGRLRDNAKGRILYDGILIYSNGSGRSSFSKQPDRMPYERIANTDAACRPIEEYCAPEGAKLFVQDLKAAARFLAKRLVEEAGVSPGRDNEPWISNVIDSRDRIVRDWMELVE